MGENPRQRTLLLATDSKSSRDVLPFTAKGVGVEARERTRMGVAMTESPTKKRKRGLDIEELARIFKDELGDLKAV